MTRCRWLQLSQVFKPLVFMFVVLLFFYILLVSILLFFVVAVVVVLAWSWPSWPSWELPGPRTLRFVLSAFEFHFLF